MWQTANRQISAAKSHSHTQQCNAHKWSCGKWEKLRTDLRWNDKWTPHDVIKMELTWHRSGSALWQHRSTNTICSPQRRPLHLLMLSHQQAYLTTCRCKRGRLVNYIGMLRTHRLLLPLPFPLDRLDTCICIYKCKRNGDYCIGCPSALPIK